MTEVSVGRIRPAIPHAKTWTAEKATPGHDDRSRIDDGDGAGADHCGFVDVVGREECRRVRGGAFKMNDHRREDERVL
jgi:hypothetical protein